MWLATGYTDMRCGFPSLALRVQEVLKHNPLSGNLFCFRGKCRFRRFTGRHSDQKPDASRNRCPVSLEYAVGWYQIILP
ncbi:IS66 family insertion sequence element accessory protein TnpB [Mesorhizobium sp.]|uniref:IS66 family insertion sequence element accessory protein TnpB n=1 Tax=Mesorhizobium sp. TaxID=1871066 RepID=UPI0032B024DE